ncbi:ATP-binding cassette domain-containing protein [Mesorhizobium sp. BAC0120]|uniref:ATP-binding cassette domain-containing protein n=1 Tax=Mesorhizobium sp. BAC0120 TaxID=3090670 RepID=UPI00298D5EFA|nr:ATP-binding cassette domain-containing protein [Mesorhizobium sp. BAC0120]MDW6026310.1 ATP-binding cassette domain-containing protein [Mesorhizobium sp. BAC0120]
MTPVLEVSNLRKSFGPVEALRGVDLQLQAGEVLAIVGDNGAGKSTLIKHISGVYKADAGHMLLAGEPLDLSSPREARQRGIETVYQDLALADDLSIGANIFLGREPIRRLFGLLPYVDDRTIRRETAELLKKIRSEIPAGARTVARLSGGQRQAVAIARAIYWQAKVVLLDEPTAALAVMERERVIQHARDLAAHGVGVIYIGHNLTEILKVADRIAVMFRGRTVHITKAGETSQETLIKYMTGYSDSAKAA